MFKLPTMKNFTDYVKRNWIMLVSGIALGWAGAYYYFQVVPREAYIPLGRETAIAGLELSPEAKVIISFVGLGFLLAIAVNEVMKKK